MDRRRFTVRIQVDKVIMSPVTIRKTVWVDESRSFRRENSEGYTSIVVRATFQLASRVEPGPVGEASAP